VRRHAKASTAGSTQRQAGRLGRFFRGGLATRASSSRVKGSGAPSTGRLTSARGLFGLACLAILALTALLGGGASSALAAEECPNEVRRQEQGIAALALPDCRAYESASPGSQPYLSSGKESQDGQASLSGDQILYQSRYPAVGEERSGQRYVSTRGPEGWVPKSVTPQEGPNTNKLLYEICSDKVFYSPDFSKSILMRDFRYYDSEGFCERHDQILDPRETYDYRNLFLRSGSSETYELLTVLPEGATPGNSFVNGASDDFSKVFFRSEAQLTPEAPGVTPGESGGFNLFVWSEGTIRLVTFLPDGTPVQGSAIGNGDSYTHRVSVDGSRALFTYGGALYVRLNPDQPPSAITGEECTEPEKACTLQVDESQGSGSSGGGDFEFANADGSRVFFTSDKKLTADSTAVAGKPDLYEFDDGNGTLSDLTVSLSEPATVDGVSGFSEDGSYVYFAASAALAPGALAGNCAGSASANCNLYVEHEGSVEFVAALSAEDSIGAAQASPNGRFLAFVSRESITGYDNVNPDTGNPVGELFLYDASSGQVDCVSCRPDGEPPIGFGVSLLATVTPASSPNDVPRVRKNNVLDDGRVFFDTVVPLVAADVNGNSDVYEWEDGEAHLISTGTDPAYSSFVATNPSGSDVFFTTAEGIVASDTDGAATMYDARVGGGFDEAPPLPGCEGEACRGAGTGTPSAAVTGSAAFQGTGNLKRRHKRDCGIAARRAQKVSRIAKRLRRRAKRANSARQAQRLRHRAAKFAKRGKRLSKGAKRCRRANRRAGK
jgi:hypothetical protein